MGDKIIKFQILADSDGYVTFQCPYCSNTFKLRVDECQEDEVIEFFCPYCGLADEPSSFLNNEIIQLAMDKAENYFIDILNGFSKNLDRSFRGNKMIKVKTNKIPKKGEKEVFEVDSEEVISELKCCSRHIKTTISAKESGLICPYCGVR
ncbi:MAG: hypothetical protein PWP31_1432 [Clostridia bacterium]|nr:hypothetical protein [Clostridia bacterium]MDK2901351.1 hypothetical protein [Thermosediminibacterales bacterium]